MYGATMTCVRPSYCRSIKVGCDVTAGAGDAGVSCARATADAATNAKTVTASAEQRRVSFIGVIWNPFRVATTTRPTCCPILKGRKQAVQLQSEDENPPI